ncbi:hypothetical protein BMW24_022940 [Mycobacterium heckeshornense]|uniref:Uncharacterized protein n=1 Tax=Mycobacterium heckeshornense TaxID=110505 RepID=A0A2G8AVB6_9MYCO|nr:hypothetical protein ACT16_15780 [Mycobacterium heckeshornense]PIJ29461.1 hypothetical protein BMW24_022940 [Mycobacterium heckeshornense]BCO35511.1 hypothetical protein MHEC_19440 [Mycobacterium heckeshornense]
MVQCFTCRECAAPAEPVTEGGATIAVVRHQPGCSVLIGVIRRRWPLRRDLSLPRSPAPQPFAQRADWGRWRKAVEAMQAKPAAMTHTHARSS